MNHVTINETLNIVDTFLLLIVILLVHPRGR